MIHSFLTRQDTQVGYRENRFRQKSLGLSEMAEITRTCFVIAWKFSVSNR